MAEELTFGPEGVTTGAEDDLRAVTALAWRMVTHWGMGKQLGAVFADYCEAGPVAINSATAYAVPSQPCWLASDLEQSLPLIREKAAISQHTCTVMTSASRYISSDTMAALIDCEVQSILHDGRATAYTLLSEHDDQLTKLGRALMEHEQLNRAQFEATLQQI